MQSQPLHQGDYLQLRSRKLEKPPPPHREPAARRKGAAPSELAAAEAEADEVSFGENVLELEPVER
jgi:hypothetical protein